MTVVKLAISLQRELAAQIQKSAAGEPMSTWLADAARRKLRNQALLDLVAEWEEENGVITPAEMAAARTERITARRGRKPKAKAPVKPAATKRRAK